MAQDTTGTDLATTTAAQHRHLTQKVIIDWTRAGFAASASWTDESSRVKSLRGVMQAIGWQHSIGAVGHGVALPHGRIRGIDYFSCFNKYRIGNSNISALVYTQNITPDIIKRTMIDANLGGIPFCRK